MAKNPYHLFPIFRSDTMARLTERLCVNQTSETITALAAGLGVSVSAVSQIIPALEKSKVVTVTRFGTSKLIAANTAAPFYRLLRELLEIVAGPPVVLAKSSPASEASVTCSSSGHMPPGPLESPDANPTTLTSWLSAFPSGGTCSMPASPLRSAWAAKSTRSSGPRWNGSPRRKSSFACLRGNP